MGLGEPFGGADLVSRRRTPRLHFVGDDFEGARAAGTLAGETVDVLEHQLVGHVVRFAEGDDLLHLLEGCGQFLACRAFQFGDVAHELEHFGVAAQFGD